jgi:membrane protease YdiL (CAAX protease family)
VSAPPSPLTLAAELRGVGLLSGAQLKAVVRDRTNLLMAAVFALLSGGGVALYGDLLVDEAARKVAERRAPQAEEAGAAATVAIVGEPPGWLALELEQAPAERADALLVIEGDAPTSLQVVALGERWSEVSDEVWRQIRRERARRLDALGITERPRQVAEAELRVLTQEPAEPRPRPSGLGVTLVFMGAFLMNPVLDALPRARASGYLEALVVAPLRRRQVILSAWLSAWIIGLVVAALTLLGFALGAAWRGDPIAFGLPVSLLPALEAVMAAAAVAMMYSADGVRQAYLRSFWWVPTFGAAAAAAALAGARWGPWVPLGGTVATSVGVLGDASGTLAAAWVSGLVTTAGLLAVSARGLARADVVEGGVSRLARRRAAGNWRPEALLLCLIGFAGLVSWRAVLPASTLAGATAMGLVAFLLLPALAAGPVLGLPPRALLRLRAPPARAWLAVPLVVAGTQSLGLLAQLLQSRVLPSAPWALEGYAEAMTGMSRGWGLLALTAGPGICEELMFRGAVMSLLALGLRGRWAIPLQAVAFAAMHVYGFKLLPTFAVGVVLGLLVWRCRSIWPAMLAHALHNLIAFRLLADRDLSWIDSAAGAGALAAAGAAGLAAAWLSGAPAEPD